MNASPHLFAKFIKLKGVLTVKSPLKVRSGEQIEDGRLKTDKGNATLAKIECDGEGKPYLPGSGIKGALRAYAEATKGPDHPAITLLFGDIKNNNTGHMGALTIYGAQFRSSPDQNDLPYYNKPSDNGIHLSARTKIESGLGRADHGKLFHAEAVTPNTTFSFSGRFVPLPRDEDNKLALKLLAEIVLALKNEYIYLGGSRADGAGRISAQINCQGMKINSQGLLEQNPSDHSLLLPVVKISAPSVTRLVLQCDGPFFVNDWSYQPPEKKNGKPQGPQMRMLREADHKPVLPIETVMGALRATSEWLEKCKRIEKGSTARLFGPSSSINAVAARAILMADQINLIRIGRTVEMSSVSLDRFSGAPMTGALFSTACVFDPRFEIVLRLDRRPNSDKHEDDQKAWRDILAHVKKTGLKLGHAKGRGFGWFKVEEA